MEVLSHVLLLAMAIGGAAYGAACLTEVLTMHPCFWVRYSEADRHWQVISPSGQVVNRCPLESQATEWAKRWNRTLSLRPDKPPKQRPERSE